MRLPTSTRVATLLISLIALMAVNASAKIYTWTDENGKKHFTDKPPKDSNDYDTVVTKPINVQQAVSVSPQSTDDVDQLASNDTPRKAKSWAAKNCKSARKFTYYATQYTAAKVKVCKKQIPGDYRQHLSGYSYDPALYNYDPNKTSRK
ncbi:Uncharacterised protein [BD1-7 clade bacterium]|uniref:DUF4124 domain-containing protein n=1 Tax=BD1-7 clade bacterium TaxID=2029982 RepID=A0A5S9PK94_9GAMM|nr:Uncharacterised protein [BD1-7 clade bacterium]CAA0104570.1 Uncharacterised protein [BD1-7 clade bacterium]